MARDMVSTKLKMGWHISAARQAQMVFRIPDVGSEFTKSAAERKRVHANAGQMISTSSYEVREYMKLGSRWRQIDLCDNCWQMIWSRMSDTSKMRNF